MDFEWHNSKATSNEAKHGVGFGEATEVFGDNLSIVVADPDHSSTEQRQLIFGQTEHGRHLVVSFTERSDRIRIISARQMTRQERCGYET